MTVLENVQVDRHCRTSSGPVRDLLKNGFEQIVNNAYFDHMDNKTPIEGLYLAGGWSSPGGGFSGVLVGGQLAFRTVMADWSKRKSDEPLQSGGGK